MSSFPFPLLGLKLQKQMWKKVTFRRVRNKDSLGYQRYLSDGHGWWWESQTWCAPAGWDPASFDQLGCSAVPGTCCWSQPSASCQSVLASEQTLRLLSISSGSQGCQPRVYKFGSDQTTSWSYAGPKEIM